MQRYNTESGAIEQLNETTGLWEPVASDVKVERYGEGYVIVADEDGDYWRISTDPKGSEPISVAKPAPPSMAKKPEDARFNSALDAFAAIRANNLTGYKPKRLPDGQWTLEKIEQLGSTQYPNQLSAQAGAEERTRRTGKPHVAVSNADGSYSIIQGGSTVDFDREIEAAILAGDTVRAQALYDQKQQLELQSPGFQIGREDKATEERRRQLEWNMSFAATQEEKDWAARQWTAEFGQRQWEASQQAQREALKLGIDISGKPADWWALENLRYGTQPNRPYTGAEVAPRTWVDEWLKFAQQPQGVAPPVPRRITPPGFVPTYGEPAPPAETVAKAPAQGIVPTGRATTPAQPGAPAFPQPGYPFAPVPGSQGSPPFATEADAKAWRVANSRATTQADIPDLNAAWGIGAAPGSAATGGGTNNPSFVGAEQSADRSTSAPATALPPVPAQARFEAIHPVTKETAIISSNEIPGFNEAGFEIKKQVKLYDFLPYQLPGFGSGTASPLSRLPQQGVRQALFGQPVSRPRNWPTLGAPTMPSAQSWAALPWEGQQIFQSEVERLGVPWQSYSQEMASLWPSWGTPGRFRRVPGSLGPTGG